MLDQEEDFYNEIDELEHGVGINQSMVDWANINFDSPFGTSGEFEGRRASVAQEKSAQIVTSTPKPSTCRQTL